MGAIAYHCSRVYLNNPAAYDDYIPLAMLGASNDFYNFIVDSYFVFSKGDGATLKAAWEMYKNYCDEAKVTYPFSQRVFKEELKNYFDDYRERHCLDDGTRVRSYYSGLRLDKFEKGVDTEDISSESELILFDRTKSYFDEKYSDCFAQYATDKETPCEKWDSVQTTLSDLDTSRLHYVRVPENHIVIDFDIPGEDGNKSLAKNLEQASKFPPTYAEISKGGQGIHLHYVYNGEVSLLERSYAENIEIKVFTGKSSLRRKLTKYNNLPIMSISSGLPTKEGGKHIINFEAAKSEKRLREMIKRNLNKEFHPGTKPSIDFIYKILEDAYNNGVKYDVSDLRAAILVFAANSSNQADYCVKMLGKMKFKSEAVSVNKEDKSAKLVFYDVEVFPNLFLVNWKIEGEGKPVVRMINPEPPEIEELMQFRLVGFNCRRYDNHLLYACLMDYTQEQLFNLSQKIIGGSTNCFLEKPTIYPIPMCMIFRLKNSR